MTQDTVATQPEGYLQNQEVDFPCFQKFELRENGRKFSVFELSWYPGGTHYNHLWSFHFSREEAVAEMTRKECQRDNRPLPPGRYAYTFFNGKKAEGLAESTATLHAKKNAKKLFEPLGLVPEVVPDKYNPGKFAVIGVLIVPEGSTASPYLNK